jgi:hypothetical protein
MSIAIPLAQYRAAASVFGADVPPSRSFPLILSQEGPLLEFVECLSKLGLRIS